MAAAVASERTPFASDVTEIDEIQKTDYICTSKESERPASDTLDEILPLNQHNAMNETEYLMSSKEMEKAILTGMEDVKKGNFIEVNIDDLEVHELQD